VVTAFPCGLHKPTVSYARAQKKRHASFAARVPFNLLIESGKIAAFN
jgi:hypothetical protein